MKKILAIIMSVLLLFATPIAVFASGDSSEVAAVTTPTKTTENGIVVTEAIVAWITDNIEEISVVLSLIGYGILTFSRLKNIIKSAGTINNNAITIANTNKEAIDKALANIENVAGVLSSHDTSISALLEAFKITAEDKQRLEAELAEIKGYLKTSSKSNLEFADELAELLNLSNIPNFKKEEIGARHIAAKKEILDAGIKAEAMLPTTTEEVKENVGEKA